MRIDAEDLEELVRQGEGRELEFKRGLPRDEKTARTLCAFANTRGGMLLVGVTDHGELCGVHFASKVRRQLAKIAAERLDPPLHVETRALRVGQVDVVCCSVPLSASRPHEVRAESGEGLPFVRVGSSNRRAQGATLRALRQPRSASGLGPLEREVLTWVGERAKRSLRPDGDATVRGFAKARNVGVQRARRAFTQLERNGRLVGHGLGTKRVFSLA